MEHDLDLRHAIAEIVCGRIHNIAVRRQDHCGVLALRQGKADQARFIGIAELGLHRHHGIGDRLAFLIHDLDGVGLFHHDQAVQTHREAGKQIRQHIAGGRGQIVFRHHQLRFIGTRRQLDGSDAVFVGGDPDILAAVVHTEEYTRHGLPVFIGNGDGVLRQLDLFAFLLAIALFEFRQEIKAAGRIIIGFIGQGTHGELDPLALLGLDGDHRIALVIGLEIRSLGTEGIAVQIVKGIVVFNTAGCAQAGHCQLAVGRSGIDEVDALVIVGTDIHAELTHGQVIGVALGALELTQGGGKGFRLFAGIADADTDRGKGIRRVQDQAYAAAVGVVGQALIHHKDIGAGDLEVQILDLVQVHIPHFPGLDRDLEAADTAQLRGVVIDCQILLADLRQVLQVFHHLGGILIGSEIIKHIDEGLSLRYTAGVDHGDGTVPVDHHGCGIGIQLHGLFPLGIHLGHGEGQAQFLLELADLLIVGVNGIQRQDLQLVAVDLISLLEKGELIAAGLALAVPEVQHDRLLIFQKLGECVLGPVGSRDRKILHLVPQLEGHFLQIDLTGQIAAHLNGGSRSGEAVDLFEFIAFRHTAEYSDEAVGFHIVKGDLSLAVGLCEPDQLRLGLVGVDIHTDSFQRHTAFRHDLDGIAHGNRFLRGCFRLGRIRLFVPAASQRKAQANHQTKGDHDAKQFFHFHYESPNQSLKFVNRKYSST